MLRLLLEKCNILHPSSMFQSFIDTSTTAGNGIDMSWFYSYKTPRQNVNIWLFTFTVKAKRGFFASFLCDVCMRACVLCTVDDMLVVKLLFKCCRIYTKQRTKNLHLFVFCTKFFDLSFSHSLPSSLSLSQFSLFFCIYGI